MNALLSARKAEKLGYKNVKVFEAGWPAWKKAGHIVVSDIANIKNLNKLEAPYMYSLISGPRLRWRRATYLRP